MGAAVCMRRRVEHREDLAVTCMAVRVMCADHCANGSKTSIGVWWRGKLWAGRVTVSMMLSWEM